MTPAPSRPGSSASLRSGREVRADAAVGARPSRVRRVLGGLAPSHLAAKAGSGRFPLAAPNWPETMTRPAPERELGVSYDTAWSRKYPVRLARALLLDNLTRPLAHMVASPLIRGAEYLAQLDGPVIFASNHASQQSASSNRAIFCNIRIIISSAAPANRVQK